MEHPYILPFIEQRMKELGHTNFHYESVRLTVNDAIEPSSDVFYDQVTYVSPVARPLQFTADNFYIMAHNQYYFLVEKTVPASLEIVSDSDCLTPEEATNYSNYTFFNFKEFTGQIFLKAAVSIELEFVKCTPYNN